VFLYWFTRKLKEKNLLMELDIIGKRIKGIRALLQKDEDKNFCRSISIFFKGKDGLIAAINADTDEVIIITLKRTI